MKREGISESHVCINMPCPFTRVLQLRGEYDIRLEYYLYRICVITIAIRLLPLIVIQHVGRMRESGPNLSYEGWTRIEVEHLWNDGKRYRILYVYFTRTHTFVSRYDVQMAQYFCHVGQLYEKMSEKRRDEYSQFEVSAWAYVYYRQICVDTSTHSNAIQRVSFLVELGWKFTGGKLWLTCSLTFLFDLIRLSFLFQFQFPLFLEWIVLGTCFSKIGFQIWKSFPSRQQNYLQNSSRSRLLRS